MGKKQSNHFLTESDAEKRDHLHHVSTVGAKLRDVATTLPRQRGPCYALLLVCADAEKRERDGLPTHVCLSCFCGE